jgi:hypothetical protein
LPTDSVTPSSLSNNAILSPFACLSNDHYAGIGSPSPDVHALKSVAAEQPSFAADLLVSVVQTSPSIDSPADL